MYRRMAQLRAGRERGSVSDTTAETLRRAAGLMRERAERATPGPWQPVAGVWQTETFAAVIGPNGVPENAETWLMATGRGAASQEADAEHAASMHPGVVAPLADLLDEVARQYEAAPCNSPDGVCNGCESRWDFNFALSFARTYLGGEAPA
jgi:hypothetical protein